MDEQKQKLLERIKQAQNVLVTVSTNPSVDQLASAIGLTLALNKLNKHGTAVFSGQVPSTIEFLKPEDTLERNTDSLRDFIIALDKSKADKLRYKVEDQVVRIFITPYRTSLSEKDLNFAQGDFNVDVVIALGVTEQQDLDAAITAHGRILHDAAVASITTTGQGSLGSINWVDPTASSLSEMITNLVDGLDKQLIDNQIATALLTGIVASTDRFSNEKTTPRTMSISAELMAAGADQRLIATELEASMPTQPVVVQADAAAPSAASASTAAAAAGEVAPETPAAASEPAKEPGTLEIEHEAAESEPTPGPAAVSADPAQPQISVDEDGQLHTGAEEPAPGISHVSTATDTAPAAADAGPKRGLIIEPPHMGSETPITANSAPEGLEPSAEELTLPTVSAPLLKHNETVLTPLSVPAPAPVPPTPMPPAPVPAPALTPPPVPAPAPAQTPMPMPPAPEPPLQPAPPAWQPPEPPALSPLPTTPAPAPPPLAPPSDGPAFNPLPPADIAPPPADVAPAAPEVPATPEVPAANLVDDARSAVQAAFNSPDAPPAAMPPLTGLNAMPLGPDLHQPEPVMGTPVAPTPAPVLPNPAFGEPVPGSTPADSTLDMPLPSNPFGPGMQMAPAMPPVAPMPAPPSAFPGAPAPGSGGPLPPPVPPPMVPPAL